jgi:F420H(2)-dependent quinone reductase
MSGFGTGAQWYRNVLADPAVEIRIGRERWPARARTLETDEAVAVLAGYERRNRFAAPIVRTVLSRLAGFRYDGTDAARRRLVGTLPLVAFRRDG